MSLLKLLGVPRFIAEDRVLDLPPRQVLLLASYLAYKEDWCSRDELLHLFWPNEGEKEARHNLSQRLYQAKGQPWITGLETERNRVRWLVDTDVENFRDALGDGDWAAACEQYGGQLLEGVNLKTSTNFGDWLAQEREGIQAAWREAVLNHAEALREDGQARQASQHLQAVIKQDSLAEDVVQAYLRVALAGGHREGALKAFDTFRQQLEQELGMDPLESTIKLANELRSSRNLTPASTPPARAAEARLYNFPLSHTPFIGRDLERVELTNLLYEEDRRLITLLGPGGVGKTRLAAQLAKEQTGRFGDGAVFVPLAPLEDARYIAQTVLAAAERQAPSTQDELSFLKQFLSDKQILLVMDNAEHLLDSALIMTELLDAPGVTILATSRVALEVQGESIYDLEGLLYPQNDVDNLEDYDAVAFFLSRARRAHPTFSLDPNNRSAVISLCQLLNGLPLALELAATWMRLLSPAELVEEITKSLDALESNHKDISQRHQSMRAVLKYSWQLLSDAEQDALSRLAVFQGGFTKSAAQTVASASLRTLLSLVNKSLLQRTQGGRFERLVVVRQYSLEQLSSQPELLAETRLAHAEHFVAFAEEARAKLVGEEVAKWLEALSQDHDNLRSALRWLIDSGHEALGLRLGSTLFRFWWLRGHYREGRAFMDELLALSDERTPARARALSIAGSMARLSGDLPAAKRLYQQSLALDRALENDVGVASNQGNLGLIYRLEGDYKSAKRMIEATLAIHERLGDKPNVANGLNNLAAIVANLGDEEEAWRLNEASLKLANDIGERFVAARALADLGSLAQEKGELERAQAFGKEALGVLEELEYRVGIIACHQLLGDVALAKKDYRLAQERYLEALRCAEDLDDTRRIATVLDSISELMMALGQVERALCVRGAASQFFTDLGIKRQPDERASLETHLKRGRDKLGAGEVGRLLSEGAQLSVKEAAAEATSEPIPTHFDGVN